MSMAFVLNAIPTLYFAGTLIQVSLRTVLAPVSRVFVAGIGMVALVRAVDLWASPRLAPLEVLAIEVAGGVVAYWGALRLFRVEVYRDVAMLLARPSRSTAVPDPDHVSESA